MSQHSHQSLQLIVEEQRKLDYPELESDKYFEIFAASQVLKRRRLNPDPDEVLAGITGGDGDAGVDGFYIFCNRRLVREDVDLNLFVGQQVDIELVVVQAKNKPSFEESVPMKFKDFVDNCLSSENQTEIGKKLYSAELLDMVARFHKLYRAVITKRPSLKASFYHVAHADQVDQKVTTRGTLLCDTFNAVFTVAKSEYVVVTGTELIKMYHEKEETSLSLPVGKHFDFRSFDRDAYVAVVKIYDFYQQITADGELREILFDENVRDHQPDATVNQGIRDTLESPKDDDFWWLNNGITILGTVANYSSGKINITDPRVVNGLQTSHEIFRHFKGGGNIKDDRTLMVKVIGNDRDETSDRIIRATNSQTKINSMFLHSTEQIHREIEVALKPSGFYYDRRKNYYKNRGFSASQIVTIPFMVQAIAAIALQQPDDARVRPGTVVEKSYKKLFGDAPIQLYVACVKLMKRCFKFLNDKKLGRTDVLNLVFYLAMYVTCVACKSVKPKRPTIAALNVDQISDKTFEDCFVWIRDELARLGGGDRVAKGPNLTASLKAHIIDTLGKKKNDGKAKS